MEQEYIEAKGVLELGSGKIHLMGVAGVGMAGLAALLHWQGFEVSGCDLKSNELTEWLQRMGITVYKDHSPSHIERDCVAVVRSTAVAADNREAAHASRMGIPLIRRGILLSVLVNSRRSVAVSGTHGKTTTVAMLAEALRLGGADPSFFVGGIVDKLGGVAGDGDGVFVAEGDESDGTLKNYSPSYVILTNADVDHLEHYNGEEDLWACFQRFADQATEGVIYNHDDLRTREICAANPLGTGFGFGSGCEVRGRNFSQSARNCRFDLYRKGQKTAEIELPVSGQYNAYNALAVCAIGFELGFSAEELQEHLAGYQAPRRRFELVGSHRGATVYQDYSHHPTEIKALIQSLEAFRYRRLIAVFQPHRYTRTRALGKDFPDAFQGVDELVLVPVFAASEEPIEGGRSEDLFRHFLAKGAIRPYLADSLESAWDYLGANLEPGDILLILGAGDIELLARWLAEFSIHNCDAGTQVHKPRKMPNVEF